MPTEWNITDIQIFIVDYLTIEHIWKTIETRALRKYKYNKNSKISTVARKKNTETKT